MQQDATRCNKLQQAATSDVRRATCNIGRGALKTAERQRVSERSDMIDHDTWHAVRHVAVRAALCAGLVGAHGQRQGRHHVQQINRHLDRAPRRVRECVLAIQHPWATAEKAQSEWECAGFSGSARALFIGQSATSPAASTSSLLKRNSDVGSLNGASCAPCCTQDSVRTHARTHARTRNEHALTCAQHATDTVAPPRGRLDERCVGRRAVGQRNANAKANASQTVGRTMRATWQ